MADKSKFLEPLAVRLASGCTVRDAAGEIGCSESHAYRIANLHACKMRVSELRAEMTNRAVGELAAGAALAVQTLVELLQPVHEPQTRLNAAKALLGLLAPLQEAHELRQRITDLETAPTLQVAS